MKTKILGLGIFLVVALFVAGCTTTIDDKTDELGKDTQLSNSQDNLLLGTYILDTANSKMTWSASKIASNYHTGTINLKSGTLGITGDATSGEFIIDMTSITSDENNDNLLAHIKNEDFFNVNAYPQSNVNIKSLTKLEGNEYEVTADLTILDVTNEIKFNATLNQENDVLLAKADFEIDRTKWNITYGSGSFFKEMGDKAIKDEISFSLDLKFNLEK